MILPSVKKFAVGIGGTGGRGPMSCRESGFTGKWSPPAMYEIGGASAGFQVGGKASDIVIAIMAPGAVDKGAEQQSEGGHRCKRGRWSGRLSRHHGQFGGHVDLFPILGSLRGCFHRRLFASARQRRQPAALRQGGQRQGNCLRRCEGYASRRVPGLTSRQQGWEAREVGNRAAGVRTALTDSSTRAGGSCPRQVGALRRIDSNGFAFVNERRHLYHQPGFRLGLAAGGGRPQSRLRPDEAPINHPVAVPNQPRG